MKKSFRAKSEYKFKIIQKELSKIDRYGGKLDVKLPDFPQRVTEKFYMRLQSLYRMVKKAAKEAEATETHAHRVVREAHEERERNSPSKMRRLGQLGNKAFQENLKRMTEKERKEFYSKRSKKAAETRKRNRALKKQSTAKAIGDAIKDGFYGWETIKENFNDVMNTYHALLAEIDAVADQYVSDYQAEFHANNAMQLREILTSMEKAFGGVFYEALNEQYDEMRDDINVILYGSVQEDVDASLVTVSVLLTETINGKLMKKS